MQFGNLLIPTGLNVFALGNGGTPAASLTLTDDGSATLLFASSLDGSLPTDWATLDHIDLRGTSGFVILSGKETSAVSGQGGGLLAEMSAPLPDITGGTGNSFYDLSSLASIPTARIEGGSSKDGASEVAFASTVFSPSQEGTTVTLKHIQVLDSVSPSFGGVIDFGRFEHLETLAKPYALAGGPASTSANSAPAGFSVLQLLGKNGSASRSLESNLEIKNVPFQAAINLQAVTNGTSATRPNTGQQILLQSGFPIEQFNQVKVWISNDGFSFGNGLTGMNTSVFTSSSFATADIYLPADSGTAGHNAIFLGSSFFHHFPAPGQIGTVNFYDNGDGALEAASDLYLGRTVSPQSEPFESGNAADPIGHDSVFVRGNDGTITHSGAGMLFIGATDASKLLALNTRGLVMDVAGTATGTYANLAGITASGSETYQNLLQGTSGQLKLDTSGRAADAKVYTPLVQYGQFGNGLSGIGKDQLTGGAGVDQGGNAKLGGDNFFGAGGDDTITLSTTSGRAASTVWIGVYNVGHGDGSLGTADVGATYGQAITDVVLDAAAGKYVENYVNGYGYGYESDPDFQGFATVVQNFEPGAHADIVSFYAPNWATGPLGTAAPSSTDGPLALGLLTAGGQAIAPGDKTVIRSITTPGAVVDKAANVIANDIGVYADAQTLAAALASPLSSVRFNRSTSQLFTPGSIEHLLMAYRTPTGVNIADVRIENVSAGASFNSFDTADQALVQVDVTDLVILQGLPSLDALTGDNIKFAQLNTVATPGGGPVAGGSGNDIVVPGAEIDIITLGAGTDTVRGMLSALNGDVVTDFSPDDAIAVAGASLTGSDVRLLPDGQTIEIGDGAPATLNLVSPLTGGDLMVSRIGNDTVITFEAFLPALTEGGRVSDAAITGIVNRSYLNGDTSSSFRIAVDANASAGFDNALGVYEVRSNGSIGDVQLLAANVKTVSGVLNVTGVDPGSELGFFIVQNGANRLPSSVLTGEGTLSVLPQAAGFMALAHNGLSMPGLVTFFSHSPAANVDGMEHTLSGVAGDGSGALSIGFEDLIRTGRQSDDDFQDVVVSVFATGWLL